MNKDLIREYLNATFLVEETKAPGLKSTEAIQKNDEDINKEAMKDVEKKMEEYLGGITGEKENEEVVKKYNLNDEQKAAHERGELPAGTLGVMEVEGDTEEWDERQKEAVEGSQRMGNKNESDKDGEVANVVPGDQAGFKGPQGNKDIYDNNQNFKEKSEDAIDAIDARLSVSTKADTNDAFLGKNKENKKTNESKMKRLVFKKEFKGVENALKLIPESYKIDNKTFQMTDGNEKYEIRWEGDINEGRAIVLSASDKKLMNEDMQKMKHLMGYKSQDTLGNLKGEARINENKSFNDIWDKTKGLLEENETMQEINNLNAFDYMNSDKEHQAHLNKLKDKKAEFKKSDERRVHPACFNSYNPDTGGGWKLPELIEFLKNRYNIEDSHIEQIKNMKNSMEVRQYLTQEFGECPK